MGRNCGYLALMSAIAGGAEAVLIPEFAPRPEEIMRAFQRSWEQGKPHFIVVAAEGAPLSAEEFHEYVNDARGGFESRDRKSTRLNSSHANISYAVFCLKKKNSHLERSPASTRLLSEVDSPLT